MLDDGGAPMELEYASVADRPEWDRFTLRFAGGGRLRLNDARRLGGVELDPDEGRLGPDAFTVTLGHLRRVLRADAPVKAVLLDQSRIAGLGNMLVDEMLYRAGIDPARPARGLTEREIARLHRAVRVGLPELLERGGSHTGRLAVASRVRGASCPKDGAELSRRTIGGRTTFSCPVHQR
jgi:formamidopyrimidine-DNA glycosylase